tara:strand:+ start:84 stop:1292 length:1209 start_codon:yes stop_codon:yes gene_type:complete
MAGQMSAKTSFASPLCNIKVLEVAQGVAGPHCGRLMAAMGAEVIKVELPSLGDWSRSIGPFLKEDNTSETSALFLYNNTNKQSITIDWRTHKGKKLLAEMVEESDIIITDWDVETRERHSLPKRIFGNPDHNAIHLSITPFGLTGPYARYKSTPIIQLALGGYLYLTGEENREPLMLPGYQPDYLAGLNGHNAVQIALWDREKTGQGSFLDMSIIETLVTLHQFTFEMYTYEGYVRKRHGNLWQKESSMANYGITTIPCSDGHICFGVATEDQWERLCLMLDREDLLSNPAFETRNDRRNQATYLDKVITDWVGNKTRHEVLLETSDIWGLPTSPVLSLDEIMDDTQFKSRDFFNNVEHPIAGNAIHPSFPFVSKYITPKLAPAPTLGQHNHLYKRLRAQND